MDTLGQPIYNAHQPGLVHYEYNGLTPNGSTGLIVLIAAKAGRVYKVMAGPDPKDTIYPAAFQQILDSFTILAN